MTRMVGSTAAARFAASTACAATLFAAPAHAEWNAKAEAGIVSARGNTDADTANAKFEVGHEFTYWNHGIAFSGIYASDEVGATAQRWDVRAQSEYKFHPKGFWFGSGRFEEDRFAGFEYQITYGTGLGWRFFDQPRNSLVAQLGAGYKVLQPRAALDEDGVTPVRGERETESIVQAGVDLERGLTDTTKVINKLLVESGGDNTFVQNTFSLEVKIMDALALAVGYIVRYNSEPPSEDFNTTDRLITLNLVYELE